MRRRGFYPRQPEIVAAVTGTSGKSSVVDFLRQIWIALGRDAASLGTIGVVDRHGAHYGSLTTPDPVALHQTLDALAARRRHASRDGGVVARPRPAPARRRAARRSAPSPISRAIISIIIRDLEEYLAAKMRLFDTLLAPGQTAVIDADSSVAARVIDMCEKRGLAIFDVGATGDAISLLASRRDALGSQLRLRCGDETFDVALPLAGDFQISNALVAAGMAIACGEEPAQVFAALENLRGAPGRLELVGERDGAPVFVDYAHKPDALDKVLAALRPLATGRLIVVFGCGGDRDSGKRPLMGEIAARAADVVDRDRRQSAQRGAGGDPRRHSRGARGAGRARSEIGDRAAAIRAGGLAGCATGDVLVVAGKGHETGQIVGDQILPFSDHGRRSRRRLQGGIE